HAGPGLPQVHHAAVAADGAAHQAARHQYIPLGGDVGEIGPLGTDLHVAGRCHPAVVQAAHFNPGPGPLDGEPAAQGRSLDHDAASGDDLALEDGAVNRHAADGLDGEAVGHIPPDHHVAVEANVARGHVHVAPDIIHRQHIGKPPALPLAADYGPAVPDRLYP